MENILSLPSDISVEDLSALDASLVASMIAVRAKISEGAHSLAAMNALMRLLLSGFVFSAFLESKDLLDQRTSDFAAEYVDFVKREFVVEDLSREGIQLLMSSVDGVQIGVEPINEECMVYSHASALYARSLIASMLMYCTAEIAVMETRTANEAEDKMYTLGMLEVTGLNLDMPFKKMADFKSSDWDQRVEYLQKTCAFALGILRMLRDEKSS